jgi:hypothetical protein
MFIDINFLFVIVLQSREKRMTLKGREEHTPSSKRQNLGEEDEFFSFSQRIAENVGTAIDKREKVPVHIMLYVHPKMPRDASMPVDLSISI